MSIVVDILNDWWMEGRVPKELTRAEVVLIYKKGNTAGIWNYRPISLLSTMCKVLAAVLNNMLEKEVETKLHATQFGFRKGKGTADAIQCIRRMIDKGESTGRKTILLLLDWEKAFDKVSDRALEMSMKRMGVSKALREMIMELYREPEFRVRQQGYESEWARQKYGIRQGCPLSPYLFTLVMTVLFEDAKRRRAENIVGERVAGVTFDEVLYADDTIVVAQDEEVMEGMQRGIEQEGATWEWS